MSAIVGGERGTAIDRDVTARPAGRGWLVDLAIAVVLGVVAFGFRRKFPPDGLFFDDAWQAFAAAKGSFSQLLTVGQTQPGFGLVLMVWSRIFGQDTVSMITPALIAGTLGPPSLYLVLRRFRFSQSVAALLGSALVVCATDIVYSGRVKSYTGEVLCVLALTLVVPWLARRTWTTGTAIAWFAGSMVVAVFSSFALLATVGAGIILVLHPKRDQQLRGAAVAAQAVGILVVLAAVGRTHSADGLNDYFDHNDGFLSLSLNPLTFGRDVFRHVTRITAMFPGGPSWFTVVCAVGAAVGLVAAARGGGRRAVAARFLIALVLLSFLGAIAHRVPFGPDVAAIRAALWMVPIIAFGLAVVLQRLRRTCVARGRLARIAFDVVLFAGAVLLLFTPIGVRRPYPNAAHAATQQVLASIGPDDVVLITRPAMFSFALDADTPVRIQANPDLIQGFIPRFKDKRFVPVDFLSTEQRHAIDRAVRSADRVLVLDSNNDRAGYAKYRRDIASQLEQQGFEREKVTSVNRASIAVYRRQ